MLYICSYCDSQYTKWQGQCDECGKWGTVKDETDANTPEQKTVSIDKSTQLKRVKISIKEINDCLGGGIVKGSFILLAGDPGIGKSTLVLQLACSIDENPSSSVLYVAGEESPEQIGTRISRLKLNADKLQFLANVSIKNIISSIKKNKPSLVIIDSIQTISDENVEGLPGNINQIKSCASQLFQIAKQENIPIIIIGHVTKEGSAAGPQTLAHMVDVVLYLEGDKFHEHRLLRSTKNRFGPTNQVGVFSMTEQGFIEVKNPSELFLGKRGNNSSGSVVSVIMEGSRPFLIEIQALTNKTSYGYPKRATSGFDLSRLELLLAVLQRRAGLKLDNQDVFLNIVAGLKTKDPSLDLAAALAIASSLSNQKMPSGSVAIGEIGLAGEIRPVSHFDQRVQEAKRLGFSNFYTPKNTINISDAIKILGIKK
ncbi:DNA repair protein RadA [Candidatus Pacearchaeota archaeon CG10_big_fil_rev_8_21_14_0_10_31_24]|nr:MAG: DNA repair protein RadA [Candidatus Pacearchaeota archaeon CG10_big_fil_rev_8_21_14_0_10_31_24]